MGAMRRLECGTALTANFWQLWMLFRDQYSKIEDLAQHCPGIQHSLRTAVLLSLHSAIARPGYGTFRRSETALKYFEAIEGWSLARHSLPTASIRSLPALIVPLESGASLTADCWKLSMAIQTLSTRPPMLRTANALSHQVETKRRVYGTAQMADCWRRSRGMRIKFIERSSRPMAK